MSDTEIEVDLDFDLVPSEVSQQVWRMAGDRCQCTQAACQCFLGYSPGRAPAAGRWVGCTVANPRGKAPGKSAPGSVTKQSLTSFFTTRDPAPGVRRGAAGERAIAITAVERMDLDV